MMGVPSGLTSVASGLVSPKFEREDEPTQEEIDMLLSEVPQ